MGETIKLELDHRHNHLNHDSSEMGYHQYHRHHHLCRSSSIPRNSDDDNDGCGGNGGGEGSPGKNDGGDDEAKRANNSSTGDASASAVRTNSLPPFDFSVTNSNTFAVTFKSPGGGLAAAAANMGLPFTPPQWKELERQAMIYKCMTASVPVPPNLLFSRDPSLPSWNDNVAYLRYSDYNTMNKDMEPGRCKRTDGKKWRCSKDVAPHQKYCERHMHRGRPRSRKHVEQQLRPSSSSGQYNNGNATANNHSSKKSRLRTANASGDGGGSGGGASGCNIDNPIKKEEEALLLEEQNIFKQPNRAFNWSVEQQQWLHLMDTKREMNAPGADSTAYNTVLQQQGGYEVEEPLSLFSYSSTHAFGPGNLHYNQTDQDQSHLFLNYSEGQTSQQGNNPTRGFIDAWSNDQQEYWMPSSDQQNPWPYSDHYLTLSMAHDAPGVGSVGASSCSPVSWPPFHSGGPLAEVLGPRSSVPVGSNPASPYTGSWDPISPPATSVSSPTGILHRALFSHSDSSVDNSPTLGAPNTSTPDLITFQWLN